MMIEKKPFVGNLRYLRKVETKVGQKGIHGWESFLVAQHEGLQADAFEDAFPSGERTLYLKSVILK
jgi:hypothetical protein